MQSERGGKCRNDGEKEDLEEDEMRKGMRKELKVAEMPVRSGEILRCVRGGNMLVRC